MAGTALILAIILFVAGLVGTVLPGLPGALLIYAGMVLYGILTAFSTLDTNFFLLQGLAVVIVFAVDFLSTAAGSRRFGGSRYAIGGAMIGTILGLVIFGPFGIILGPFLGAITAELLSGKKPQQAIRAGFGTLLGFLGGTVLKLIILIMMIITFFFAI